MFLSVNFIFFACLIISTMISISTENWFQLWMSLELNMLVFIPLMFNHNNTSIDSMMKYFIMQAFASSLFIFSMIISLNQEENYVYNILGPLSMAMKLGLFPFYFWFPQVSEGLSWNSFLILSTWQKIIPLYIMSFMSSVLTPLFIFTSALIGCLGMINQSSTRKLMAFSSISHMPWMLMSMMNNNTSWVVYLLVYSMIMFSMYLIFYKTNLSSLSSLLNMKPLTIKLTLILSLMSLGGLPPLLGFLPKWMIIFTSTNSTPFLLFTLITSSLVSIFVYLRLMYPFIFLINTNIPANIVHNNKQPVLINTSLLVLMLPFIFF